MLQRLFKRIQLAPYIECPHCHALSKHGTPECKLCNTTLSPTENTKVHIVAENLGGRYTPFIECPNCQKLMKIEIRRCRDCYEEIPEAYALSSAVTVVFNTVACDAANTIASFDTFAVLAAVIGVAIFFTDLYSSGSPVLFYFTLLFPVFPLLSVILWFYRFGKFALGDEEYLSAKRRMRRTLTLWLAFASAQIIALAIWWV
jgi:hypothetical protein